jgi:hypothetical protein
MQININTLFGIGGMVKEVFVPDWNDPSVEMSKSCVLQWMCNKYGDFKISTHKKDGSWSKHISVLEIWQKGDFWRFERANNRTLLPCELVLDMDPRPKEGVAHMKKRLAKNIKKLKEFNVTYNAYYSGSKGYHIHLIFPELLYSTHIKKKYRLILIKALDCDVCKTSDGHMIALEHEPHWKTGQKKMRLDI